MRRQFDVISPDRMNKVARVVGIEHIRILAHYQYVADEIGLELNARNIDDIDRRVVRQKIARPLRHFQQKHVDAVSAA